MAHKACLARIDPLSVELLTASLSNAATQKPIVLDRLNVTELGALGPTVLVVDVDGLPVDPLETLRMIRFVLPDCVLAVYTNVTEEWWARSCHMAGANCMLSKGADLGQVSFGLRRSIATGCFTDQSFGAA